MMITAIRILSGWLYDPQTARLQIKFVLEEGSSLEKLSINLENFQWKVLWSSLERVKVCSVRLRL